MSHSSLGWRAPRFPFWLLGLFAVHCAQDAAKRPGTESSTSTQIDDTGTFVDTAQPEEDVSEVEAWVVVADEECRSLNASWGDAYRSTIDQELRVLIERHDLLGDPTLKVQDGVCYRRSLPEISAPVPQLGRALFFSFDLSGDRDVACATCHHPLLGGADGLHISAGVGFDPSAVGADRVRGVTDVTRFASARNAPTVFNVALWDKSLFWDGRVEVATPERLSLIHI